MEVSHNPHNKIFKILPEFLKKFQCETVRTRRFPPITAFDSSPHLQLRELFTKHQPILLRDSRKPISIEFRSSSYRLRKLFFKPPSDLILEFHRVRNKGVVKLETINSTRRYIHIQSFMKEREIIITEFQPVDPCFLLDIFSFNILHLV
ncbi:hypothetical protein HanRHA438_Chr12g0551651 [Helianthus annuus]|nr:hypothetical protein HanRHA438_Chr12g0551651 [Helianthus annuus]